MQQKILSAFLALCIVLAAWAPGLALAQAPENQRQADAASIYTYQSIFNDGSTQYEGRIWTDKTVQAGSITFSGNLREEGDDPIQHEGNSFTFEAGEDAQFIVSYSALASTTEITEALNVPLDLVLVLDLSPQINSQAGKTAAMLEAVNAAIAQVLGSESAENRVAVVGYSSQAKTLLPLDHYEEAKLSFEDNDGPDWDRKGGTVTCSYTTTTGRSRQSESFAVAPSNNSGVNKYTQMGLYSGMNILKQATLDASGTAPRRPALILVGEGEAKIASTNITEPTVSLIPEDGWEDFDANTPYCTTETDQEGSQGVEILRNRGISDADFANYSHDSRHAQTFATLLTAAYMKQEVRKHYEDVYGENYHPLRVYTIGVRMDSANSPDLARIMLDPNTYLEGGCALSSAFAGYAETFFTENSVSIKDAGEMEGAATETKFTDAESLGLTAESLKYNDLFFSVSGSGENLDFGGIFDDILADVVTNAGLGATHVPGGSHSHDSGYITYVDPLGPYMEVKDVQALIHSDIIFRNKETSQNSAGATTYTFSGLSNNPVYGSHDVGDISITVTEADGVQRLEVKIPAALIPLRLTYISMNENGEPISFSHNNFFPMRLIYTVGLKEGLLDDAGALKEGAVESGYLASHTDANGLVSFYQGQYSGAVGGNGRTRGDATVTYVPAENNPFYYLQEDTQLYTNPDLSEPAVGSIDNEGTYYFQQTYYTGTPNGDGTVSNLHTETISLARPGAMLKEYVQEKEGKLYLLKGAPRLGYLEDFITMKGAETSSGAYNPNANASETAQTRMYPTYEGEPGPGKGYFVLYLGNNGRLTVPASQGATPEPPEPNPPEEDTPESEPAQPVETPPALPPKTGGSSGAGWLSALAGLTLLGLTLRFKRRA